nr:immunoglobulin heavy chain junction region [Mus musculus]
CAMGFGGYFDYW